MEDASVTVGEGSGLALDTARRCAVGTFDQPSGLPALLPQEAGAQEAALCRDEETRARFQAAMDDADDAITRWADAQPVPDTGAASASDLCEKRNPLLALTPLALASANTRPC